MDKEYNTILIVDDEQINRILLQKIFEADYQILEAENGMEALEILFSQDCRVSGVILDIQMPKMDGFEVLDAMSRDERLAGIPVIVASASNDEATMIKALSAGAVDVLTKPLNPQLIRHRFNNLISRIEATRLAERASRIERELLQAETDEVSGLYNKKAFIRRVTQMLNKCPEKRYVLMRWDIDNFKVFNDTYGSRAGDEFLKSIGDYYHDHEANMRGLLLVGRYEAEHFVSLREAECFDAEKSTKRLEELLSVEHEYPFDFIPRVGLYRIEDPTLDVSLMCDRALLALKTVKHNYEKRFAWYEGSMRKELLFEQDVVSSMKNAMLDGQFEIYLQAQYNIHCEKIVGAEALVRWNRPEMGMVPPDMFIPIFEKNGCIFELDKYVWEQACRLLRRWIDEGEYVVPLSVNVSRFDILHDTFYSSVIGLMEKYQIPVSLLKLEITESAFAEDMGMIVEKVKMLRNYGFDIEIDDFGSGYSSLNTLKDVPTNILKLDMRFFQGTSNTDRGGSILESIIRMTKWLNMPVVAEGVETHQQVAFLRSIGCSYVQGYVYARPVAIDAFEKRLREEGTEPFSITMKTVDGMNWDTFWDPNSIDSLLFSSYVGAACVIEYNNDKCEIIRANNKMPAVLRTSQTVETLTNYDLLTVMSLKDRTAFQEHILTNCVNVGDSVTGTLTIELRHDGPVHKEYLHYQARTIAKTDMQTVLYVLVENITEQKIAEQKELEMTERLRFLNEIARNLLAETDTEVVINQVLTKVLDYFQAERGFVMELNSSQDILCNTYEVCAPQVTPSIDKCKNIPMSDLPNWFRSLKEDRHLVVSADDLPCYSEGEKRVIDEQGIQSIAAVALRRGGCFLGALGVDNPSKNQTHMENLDVLGDYMAVVLTRRDLNAKINHDNAMLSEMMNDMPGGFVRMKIAPDHTITPVFINDGFCKLMHMSHDEAIDVYQKDAYAGVHPDDLPRTKAAIEEAISNRDTLNICIRIITGDRGYTPIQVYYRVTADEYNNRYLNGYYSGNTQQIELDERRKELLDNLPCGAALFELIDARIRCVHLNKTYKRLVEREDDDIFMESVDDALHPDDRDKMYTALQHAMAHACDVKCMLRIITGKGKYLSFHVLGRIVRDENDKISIYTVYTPVDQTEIENSLLRAQMELVMFTSTVAFWALNLHTHKCTALNERARELAPFMGYDSDFTNSYGSILQDSLAEVKRARQSLVNGAQAVSTVVHLDKEKAGIEWVRIGWYALAVSEGISGYALGIGEDGSNFYLEKNEQKKALDTALAEAERAKLDGTTGILNRISAETAIAERRAAIPNARCAYLLLDLDNLKHINDTYGHPQGDRALRSVAEVLKNHFRSSDIIGRIGGDEFSVFLFNVTDQNTLWPSMRKLLSKLSSIHVGENDEHCVHCSIGCAIGEEEVGTLYKQADAALYYVKRHGKNNCAFYNPNM